MTWETVIGLEVHVELATKTKIFCSCTTKFGGEPNTHCCPICMGMPGTLPVLNKAVVEYAARAGLALGCEITRRCKLDRKNYFYPDLPKAYQISQLYAPLCRGGAVELELPDGGRKTIRIREIHMEEDAGKLIHDPRSVATQVDYNRCGVPLIEIVSEPDLRSAEEVLAYLTHLKTTLEYLGVSDCKMQEGSMRADINLSVRPAGSSEMGVRTEMKNMNSFRAIGRAIAYEARRQTELLGEGRRVIQETRRWDESRDASFPMRSKENAQDYRYFPEPDIPPLELSDEWLLSLRAMQPEMARNKRARYISNYGLPEYDAHMITQQKALAELFEAAVALGAPAKEVSNWILGQVLRLLKERAMDAADMKLRPETLAELIALVASGRVNRGSAVTVFEAMFDGGTDPAGYIESHGLKQVGDPSVIEEAVKKVFAALPDSVAEYRSGKTKVFGFLVGQVMRELRGKADPAAVNEVLGRLLK